MTKSVRLALMCVLALPATQLRADGGIEHLVISGHRSGFLKRAASAGEGHVGLQQLEFFPAQRVGELLETVPGLIVSQHSGEGKANQFYLRGFNLDHGTDFATSVNGLPVNMRSHGHGQGYTDLNFLMPELIGGIDFRKGSYRGSDGDFSAAGSAQLLYGWLPDAALSLETGENGFQRQFAGKHWHDDSQSFIAAGAIERDDGPWVSAQGLKKTQFFFSWQRGDGPNAWQLQLMHYDGEWNATDQIPTRAIRSGILSRFGVVDASDGGRSRRNSLSWHWQSESGEAGHARRSEALLYGIDYRMNLWSNFTYFLNDPVRGDQFEQADDRVVSGGRWQTTWVRDDRVWLLGVETRRDDIAELGLHATQARVRHHRVREDEVLETSWSMFAELDQGFAPWLRGVFALRADDLRARVRSDRPENSGRADDALLSPRVSLIATPAKNWQGYLNFGRGFHSNDARGATTRLDPNDAETRLEPVDLLVASESGELGISWKDRSLQWSANWFQLDLDSELLFVGDGGTTEATRPSQRRGVELTAYWQISANWMVDAAVAKARARFRDVAIEGNQIPGAPEAVAGAGLSFSDLRWFASARWRYFGSRPLTEDAGQRSSSTKVLNLSAGWFFSRDWRVAIEVLNALGSRDNGIAYFYESRLANEAAAVDDQHVHPVEPRSFRLNLHGSW